MSLAVIRHAESVENADKYNGFYQTRRPYDGEAAHHLSRHIVGLTARGFQQAVWLAGHLDDFLDDGVIVYTSTYRRAIDTGEIMVAGKPGIDVRRVELLDEQHYGDATYMSKEELFATYPADADTRRNHKHVWSPPGGESLADGVSGRAGKFLEVVKPHMRDGIGVVAITHHTMIMALRALLESQPLVDVVAEVRAAKPPNAAVRLYDFLDEEFSLVSVCLPPH